MKFAVLKSVGGMAFVACLAIALGCQTSSGIRVIDPKGETRELTPEELEQMTAGESDPYLLQVGDQVQLIFAIRNIQEGETPWDYKIEVGDNMEVRLSSDTVSTATYAPSFAANRPISPMASSMI